MRRHLRGIATAGALLLVLAAGDPALAQKSGGVLKISFFDNPASMSLHEEATGAALRPMMGVFNNLVMYDQHVAQNSPASIIPDLATSWSWNEDGTELKFPLRQGVKWHDGKPFTAKDVKCTWELLQGTASEKLRVNPRKTWYSNVDWVTTSGDYEVTFHLKRPQPALLALLASGWTPIYPCHVPAREMRTHPIGTGPFKFVEFRPNEHIKVTKNQDYWKPGRPYLDGIEYTIIKNLSTAILAFSAGKFDMTFPYTITQPLLHDVKSRLPQASCEMSALGLYRTLIVNREKPPFDNAELRRAMALSLDRKAFIDIITEGQGDIGGVMQPPPEGEWGMPPGMLKELPGYDPDVQKNRREARQIMQLLGYGPDNRLKVTLRDLPYLRDPAVLLIDQLKEVYIDGELDTVDTTIYLPKLMRRDFVVGLGPAGAGSDPDQSLYNVYGCGGDLNYVGYCSAEIDALIDRQSIAAGNPAERRQIIWEIERKLAADGARPVIFYDRRGTCWQPSVKDFTIMVNSTFNGARMEGVWLDK